MNDFFKIIVTSLTYAQFFIAILITIHYAKFKTGKVFSLFPVLYWFIAVVETVGLYYGMKYGKNQIIYNSFHTIRFTYFYLLYFEIAKNPYFKYGIAFFFLAYLASIGSDIFILQLNYNNQPQVTPYIIGSLGVVLSIFFYFLELLESKEVKYPTRDLFFWVSVAFFIYFLLFMFIKSQQSDLFHFPQLRHLWGLILIPTILMNVILIFGLLWSTPQKK